MRRLRFPLDMAPDESIPGAIASGVASHVLLRTKLVLDEADTSMKHAGWAQLADVDVLARIGHVIRCDEAALAQRRGMRSGDGSDRSVAFSDLRLPHVYLELDRRRIGPRALANGGHHRIDWLNKLLPYDPRTLERLVDSCMNCDTPLGWRNAYGIGMCETCKRPVVPSSEPDLHDALTEDYRLFARIFTIGPVEDGGRLRDLAPTLRGVAPETLLRLSIHLGGLSRPFPISTGSSQLVSALAAPVLAEIVAGGASLLRDWPNRLHSWVDDRVGVLDAKGQEVTAFRNRLMRLVRPKQEKKEFVDLVTSALPDLQMHRAHTFSSGRRYYLIHDTQRKLRFSFEQIGLLRTWPDLKARVMRVKDGTFVHFDADQIDELSAQLRGAVTISSCRDRFGIPIYGLEQLISRGRLEWEDHPAILLAKSKSLVTRSSADVFEQLLRQGASRRACPDTATTLSRASKRIGGGPKPWDAIMEALVVGEIPFWIRGASVSPAHIAVVPDDIARFERHTEVVAFPPGFTPVEKLSQLDAGEMLNLMPRYVPEVGRTSGFSFVATGNTQTTSFEAVASVARRFAWSAEISWHLGGGPLTVATTLKKMGFSQIGDGWSRRQMVRAGILPELG